MFNLLKKFILLSLLLTGSYSLTAQSSLAYRSQQELFNKGLELFEKGEYAAARESFEDFLDQNATPLQKEDAQYYQALSALHLFHKDAEDLLLKFIKNNPLHPKAPQALLTLGNHYFRKNDYGKAVNYYEKVNISALSAEERDEMRFKAGYAYFSQRKFDKAIEYFNQLKRHSTKYGAASSYYAGYIEYEQGEYEKAYADLTRAEESEAYASVVPYMVANVLYKQQRYNELLTYIDKAEQRKNVSQRSDLALLKAEALYNLNNFKEAANAYAQYAESQRGRLYPAVAFRYGRSLFSAGAYEKAIDPLRRAAASKEEVAGLASYILGLAYLKEDRKNEALTAFDQAVKLNQESPVAEESLFQYAKVSLEIDQTRQAIKALEKFLDKYPESKYSKEAGDLLSQAYLFTNDYQLALNYLSKRNNLTLQMQEVYQKASYLQGVEFFNANQYQQAIESFKKSLQYPKDNTTEAQARLWLAEAHSVNGNYEAAIDQYLRVLGNRQLKEEKILQQARYGLGYAYYNTNQYNRALVNFKSYVNAPNGKSYPNYQDAYLRLADSYYATKAYEQAIDAYNAVIDMAGKADKDYAHLQKGIVAGISGRYSTAVEAFDRVINDYSSSRYYDDAIFQKAQLNLEEGKYEQASSGFTKLIKERPNSRLIPYALVKRAAAYYNQQKYQEAKQDYAAVINEYVNHPVAKQVLLPLQEVLNLLNQGGQFEQYFVKYKSAHPDKEGLEAVEYETAKNMYFSQDYQKAIRNLQAFLENYPNDAMADEARFYLAESYYRSNMYEEAMEQYRRLINIRDFGQRNRVINRMADISFIQRKYQQAITYFEMLAEQAANKKELYNAYAGMMESYFLLGNYDQAISYSNQILERALVNAGAHNKALLFQGKALMQQGKFEEAKNYFQQTIKNAHDVHAAEAFYLTADLLYQQGKYRESIERLIEFSKEFMAYEEWIGKGYLLIADNYIALEDYFQARGTLQSLIENFPLDQIKEKARKKLEKIDELQLQETEEQPSSDTLEIDIKEIDN